MKKVNHKHLNLSDRIFIELSLSQNLTFAEIAKALGKDPTSISREVRKHRILSDGWTYGPEIPCSFVKSCTRKNMCTHKCGVMCKTKRNCRCFKRCPEFKDSRCKRTYKAPYVCNSCEKKHGCRKLKFYYRAKHAYDEYKDTLRTSREGINMDKEEFDRLDKLISGLVKQGQPISHICSYLSGEIPFTSRTIYNYFEKGILVADNMDLPRKVRYRKRKKRKSGLNLDKSYKQGRTYQDFQEYIVKNSEVEVVEMDTVFGSKANSDTVLLTMIFRRSSIMLIFPMPDCTQKSVSDVFTFLKTTLNEKSFSQTFPVFLTDNGNEFRHWQEYLASERGIPLSEIFFYDSNAAYQKGKIEKNHEYIRYIIPKGKPFKGLDSKVFQTIMNHINSTARPSLNGLTPFELGLKLLPPELIDGLGLKAISKDLVCLNKNLLQKL